MTERLALVLAGGGVAGIAWETGFLLGVQDEEPAAARRLLDADLLLGTSAGSAVAAQISSGTPLEELYARQLAGTAQEIAPRIDIDELIALFEHANDATMSIPDRLRWIGEHAVSAPTVSEEVRRSVIAAAAAVAPVARSSPRGHRDRRRDGRASALRPRQWRAIGRRRRRQLRGARGVAAGDDRRAAVH